MNDFSTKSKSVSLRFGMFSNRKEACDNWFPTTDGIDLGWEKRNYKFEAYKDCFYDGLNKPFNDENGTFSQHLWLTFKYPVLHFLKAIQDTLTLNLRGGILHALAVPFSFIYHVVGLFTRAIATLIVEEKPATPRFYNEKGELEEIDPYQYDSDEEYQQEELTNSNL